MSTPAPDMGAVANNATSGNNATPTGNSGTKEDEEELLIVFPRTDEDKGTEVEETCAMGSNKRPSSPGFMLVALLGLLGLARRRRV